MSESSLEVLQELASKSEDPTHARTIACGTAVLRSVFGPGYVSRLGPGPM